MTGGNPSLRLRAFTSVLIATAFLLLACSGAILFLSPPGRVANWTDWRMLGLTKRDWTGLHVWFSAVFVVATIVHTVLNFRPLVNYFKDRFTRRVGFRPEWVVALVVCGVVFAGTRAGLPPFSTFLDFNERVKRSWEEPRGAAPIPHAELLTLQELAAKAEVPLEVALQRLAQHGLKDASPEIIVANLASRNGLPAQRVYEILQGTRARGGGAGRGAGGGGESGYRGEGGGGRGAGGGGGPGRMTLTEFCESRSVDVTQAQARLQTKGIQFAPGRTLREIALDNGYDRPYEIVDIIEGKAK
jgi:uncharacterized membrane protein YgcG